MKAWIYIAMVTSILLLSSMLASADLASQDGNRRARP